MPGFNPKLKEGSNQGIVSELLQEPGNTPRAKIGRPKGRPKTKKTFYLTDGIALLQEIKLTLARDYGILFDDESEVADLAFTLLLKTVKNQDRAGEVARLYNSEIKEQP